MKTLGVDLSLTGTGIALLVDGEMTFNKSIKSKKLGDTPTDEVTRLASISDEVMEIVDEHQPDMVVLEGIAFMARNTTALAQLAGLSYLVRHGLLQRGKGFIIVAPTSLKKFVTGKGNCPKDVIMLEIYKRWDVSILDNNVADAFGLAHVGMSVIDKDYKSTEFQKEVTKLMSKQV